MVSSIQPLNWWLEADLCKQAEVTERERTPTKLQNGPGRNPPRNPEGVKMRAPSGKTQPKDMSMRCTCGKKEKEMQHTDPKPGEKEA